MTRSILSFKGTVYGITDPVCNALKIISMHNLNNFTTKQQQQQKLSMPTVSSICRYPD